MKQILILVIMLSFFGCNKKNKSKRNKEKTVESQIDKKTEELPFFGTITLSNARYYEVDDIKINKNEVSIDLNFEVNKINSKTLKSIRNILVNIEKVEKKIKKQIWQYVGQEGIVKEYLKFHIEQIDSQTLNNYLKDTDQNLTTELQLLSKIKLKRIGFFPDSPNFTVVLDYRVLSELSDEILVVILDKNGEIEKITIES